MNKVYIKKQYKTTNAVAIPGYSDSEQAFQLASSPESDMGWIVIAPWTPQEESCFFHRVVGNTVYVHGVNRTNPSLHPIGTLVYYAATIDYLNYIFSQQGNQMFIFKTSDDNVTVLGWEFYKDWDYITIPDLNTSLGLPDKTLLINSTSYIHIIDDEYKILSYRDNTYYYVGSVTTNSSGVITNITQANIKHLSSKWDKGDQWDQWEKGDTGDYGVNYRWEFNINTSYYPRDVVLENGQLYICIADSLENGVNDPLYWDLFLPKSEIVIWLQQERFVNTTSSTLELTGNPFDSDSVYVFIRQRKGVDGVDYTFNIATGVITLIGSSISTTPQTIEVLYSTTGTAGPTTIDWDNINNKPLEFSPSAHSHAIADVTNLQTTLDTKSDTWHSHNDLYYTESEVDTALASKANSTHTHNTNIAWLTFDLADNLTFSSSNSSVTITPTQDVNGNINLNLQSAASGATLHWVSAWLTSSQIVNTSTGTWTLTDVLIDTAYYTEWTIVWFQRISPNTIDVNDVGYYIINWSIGLFSATQTITRAELFLDQNGSAESLDFAYSYSNGLRLHFSIIRRLTASRRLKLMVRLVTSANGTAVVTNNQNLTYLTVHKL